MKRFLAIMAIAGAAVMTALFMQPIVLAQSTPMTEAHIQRIRANCVDAQSVLAQLHASDALLRVNRGQLYESISTKLMTPFNSRVVLNKLDGARLVSQSAAYERQLDEFRTNYKSYEEVMSKALRINCSNEPVAFYDAVTDARAKRQVVHQTTVTLQKTIQNYKTEFEAFAQQVQGKNQ
jgi:hypothetical protein